MSEIEIKPPPMRAHVSMPIPKVGVRDYFTMEHWWNARHMAQLCECRESELVDAGFRGIDRELRAFALGAVLESVAFLEALVNSVWQDAADDGPGSSYRNPHLEGLSTESVAKLREQWQKDRTEWLPILDKYQLALTCVDKPKMNLGAQPGQIVSGLILFRHALTHFKPEMQWIGERHELEQRLRPHIAPNPLLDTNPWFPHHALSASGAKLAYEKSRKFAESCWERMGFVWDNFGAFDELTAQVPSNPKG
jgi:hypothetical protein